MDAINAVTSTASSPGDAPAHDEAYQFGQRPTVQAPFPFTVRQFARLLIVRSRVQAALFDAQAEVGIAGPGHLFQAAVFTAGVGRLATVSGCETYGGSGADGKHTNREIKRCGTVGGDPRERGTPTVFAVLDL